MGSAKAGHQLILFLVSTITAIIMANPVTSRPEDTTTTTGSLQDCNVAWAVTCQSLVSGSSSVIVSPEPTTSPVTLTPDLDEGFIRTKAEGAKSDLDSLTSEYLEKHGNSILTYWPFGEAHWSDSMDLETQSGAAELLKLMGTYVRLWKVYNCSCQYEAHDFELELTSSTTRDNINNKLVLITNRVCRHVQSSVAVGVMPSYDTIVTDMTDKMTENATAQATRGNFVTKLRDFMNHVQDDEKWAA